MRSTQAIRRGGNLVDKYGGDASGATEDEMRYIRHELYEAEEYHLKH